MKPETISWPSTPDWPTVLSTRSNMDGSVRLQLTVPADSPWVEGHFPERPVLPGVVQLRWAIHAAQTIWPQLERVSRLNNVKFQRPILPPDDVDLVLDLNPDKLLLKVRYAQAEQTLSSASIVFTPS